MDNLIKRMLTLACLLLATMGMPCIAASVDIAIPENNPAMLNLARAARHALQQLESKSTVSILTTAVKPTGSGDDLLIVISDDLFSWVNSADIPHRQVLFFYVSAINFNLAPKKSTHSALFRDQPLSRQLQLAALLLPNAERALVMHRPEQFADLPNPPAKTGTMAINFRVVDTGSDWAKSLSQWMIDSDVLIGIEDNALYNRDTIRSILLTTYRHGKVLIGPNRGYVAAGSLASAYTSPEHYLQQLQDMVQHWQRSGRLPPPQFPHNFDISINRRVASSLGLSLPDDKTLLQQLQQGSQQIEGCSDGC